MLQEMAGSVVQELARFLQDLVVTTLKDSSQKQTSEHPGQAEHPGAGPGRG